jgi:hypothetical protein
VGTHNGPHDFANTQFATGGWFDKAKTERGRLALMSYRYEWNEKNKLFSREPKHDWSSNGSDAFQQLAMGHKTTSPLRRYEPEPRCPMAATSDPSRAWMLN